MEISARAYQMTVAKAAETLGVPLPSQYVAALDDADRMGAAVADIAATPALTTALHDAVLAAIEDGRDWYADKDVQMVILPGPRQNDAFGKGEVDALYAHTPFLERALLTQGGVLLVNQTGGEVPALAGRTVHTLAVTRRLHETEPGRVHFVQGERFKGLLVPFLRRLIEVDTATTFTKVNAALAARVIELRVAGAA